MSDRLQQAIEELYRVFSSYPGNPRMQGSPNYGELDRWNAELFSKPLRELDEDDLCRYAGKAITTWGTAADYKHFLPRILELTALYRPPYEIWISFDRLEMAHWRTSAEEEQLAITEYLLALFDLLLEDSSPLAVTNFPDYFSTIAYYHADMAGLLRLWEDKRTEASYVHLTELVLEQHDLLFRKGKLDGFQKTDRGVDQLTAWLRSDGLLTQLEDAFFQHESKEFAERLSWAIQLLENQRKA
ncbi:MAG: hypothetical protein AAFV25_12435 [Bacteroidota bacterium]